jgi:lipoate-protein ligase A
MSPDIWYVLNSGAETGAANMAVDEALCRFPADRPVLRFFRWDPYCISLGYGQRAEHLDRERSRQAGLDIVRRPTGGRAVLHANEVTYSVVIPRPHPLAEQGVTELYRTLSAGLAAGLRLLGASVEIKKSAVGDAPYTSSELCFASAARYEIVAGDRKVVGSAQRRFAEATLQHGSVLTGTFHHSLDTFFKQRNDGDRDHMVTVSELLDRTVSYGEVVEALSRGFTSALQIQLVPFSWTPELEARVNALMPKYLADTTRDITPQAALS